MSTHYAPAIYELIAHLQPQSVLLLDPTATTVDFKAPQMIHLQNDFWDELQLIDTCDLGIMANTLEQLDKKTGQLLLGRLRDVATKRFVVQIPAADDQWQTADFLSFGLHELAKYDTPAGPFRLFHYAIKTYKTVPDWFNSHHWAHPENWQP